MFLFFSDILKEVYPSTSHLPFVTKMGDGEWSELGGEAPLVYIFPEFRNKFPEKLQKKRCGVSFKVPEITVRSRKLTLNIYSFQDMSPKLTNVPETNVTHKECPRY